MPREGAAILSQVEGLLEQFLELDYDTPVKDAVSQMLEQVVRPGMEELRAESDASVQSEGRVPPDQGTAGEEGEQAGAPDEPEPPPQHEDMRSAREQASSDMRERKGSFAGEGPKSRGEKRQQAEEDRRRKKAKA
jgi:hypothetical protein